MSRIGKNPITIPDGVDVQIAGQLITVKGKKGELSTALVDEVEVTHEENQVWVKPRSQTKRARQMWGTYRSVIDSLMTGVTEGFQKNLEINGVGYRAQMQGKDLVLQLGFSHEVRYPVPEGIQIQCPEQNQVQITGVDKQKVGQVAAEIRAYRPPEPYKGKGVKYEGEYILRKEGKKK